jgi:hypothetical protein
VQKKIILFILKMLYNFESKVLRRIFRSKKDVVAGSREMFRNVLHNLYFSTHVAVVKPRNMRWTGHVARMEKCVRIVVGKPEW